MQIAENFYISLSCLVWIFGPLILFIWILFLVRMNNKNGAVMEIPHSHDDNPNEEE